MSSHNSSRDKASHNSNHHNSLMLNQCLSSPLQVLPSLNPKVQLLLFSSCAGTAKNSFKLSHLLNIRLLLPNRVVLQLNRPQRQALLCP